MLKKLLLLITIILPNLHAAGETDTPLHKAACAGNVEEVQQLIAAGADITQTSECGNNLLHDAAREGHATILESLLNVCPAELINAQNKYGHTPLHYAAGRKQTACVRLLLAHGADAKKTDQNNETALLLAAKIGDAVSVQALITAGAPLEQESKRVHLILSAGTAIMGGKTALHYAAENGNDDCIRALLAAGANKEALNPYGQTPLYFAAANGSTAGVQILLDAGAHPNSQSASGRTALHIAAINGHAQAIEVLADHGADLTVKDNAGNTVQDILKRTANGGETVLDVWQAKKLATASSDPRPNNPTDPAPEHAQTTQRTDGFATELEDRRREAMAELDVLITQATQWAEQSTRREEQETARQAAELAHELEQERIEYEETFAQKERDHAARLAEIDRKYTSPNQGDSAPSHGGVNQQATPNKSFIQKWGNKSLVAGGLLGSSAILWKTFKIAQELVDQKIMRTNEVRAQADQKPVTLEETAYAQEVMKQLVHLLVRKERTKGLALGAAVSAIIAGIYLEMSN